jgi:flagellar biosynthetic protein FlhB
VENIDTYYRPNLQFFAKDGPGGAKTEPASQKKLDDARKEGQTAKSKELVSAVSLFTLFLVLKYYVATIGSNLMEMFSEIYGSFPKIIQEYQLSQSLNLLVLAVADAFKQILTICLPIFVVAVIVAFLVNVIQQRWMITSKPLHPNLSKLSPLSGFKRIFSTRQLVELAKSIVMIVLVAIIVYNTLKDKYTLLFTFYRISLVEAIATIGDVIINLGMRISEVFLVVGLLDLVYQKHKFKEDMKMTKQEVKDEYKNSEGDPQIKGQIKRKMQEASRRRMMHALPQADVVITNPTHFAVALKYEADSGKAPYVLAKGADYVAFQIRDKAKEYGIEIVENKPLARLLYHNVEIGEEIPQELYQAVAEVLALVYRIKNKL